MVPPFAHNPIDFAWDLRDRGVHTRDIAAAITAGEIFRAAPGIFVTPDVYIHEDLEMALACYRTDGVVGLLSAAARHGLCDAAPARIELIVEHGGVRRPPAGLPTAAYRSRDERALTVGVDSYNLHQIKWRMTNPARTIVDLYRIEAPAHRQHAVASLATFIRDDGDEGALREYALLFDCWDVIEPEVEAINETHSRGMRP